MNQCDGCNAGYPVNKYGNHIIPYPSGSMGCQKHKYMKTTPLPLTEFIRSTTFKQLEKAIRDFILRAGDEKQNIDVKSVSHARTRGRVIKWSAIITYTLNSEE